MATPTPADLRARLDASRRELLDLGLRNQLLNYRHLRGKGVEVVDEKPTEVYRLLVQERKPFTFLPIDDDQELYTPPDAEPGKPAQRHLDTKLQTALKADALHNRLLATYYAANTFIEEQGVNILFLAMGMLRWSETDHSDKCSAAPLLLVPVELERSDAKERFHLSYTEEEMGGNISLAAKLKQDFALEYPEFPDSEDFDIPKYFDAIQSCVQTKPSWTVERETIALGFFSFGKYLMYRDLDPKSWPEGRNPTDHPILQSLLDDNGFLSESSPYSDSDRVDNYLAGREAYHVVDADSTQTLALLDAADERNLVIQGPPGTGKSQTIANLIAGAIGAGKKVLFVAEKMAALSVVKTRLDRASLGDACLELHSNKTNKKNVLAEIQRTLGLGKPRVPELEARLSLLEETRVRINDYCDAVNTPIGESGASPIDTFGHLIRVGQKDLDIPAIEIANCQDWSAAHYARRAALVSEMESFLKSTGIPGKNPFWGCRRTVFLPTEKSRLLASLRRAVDTLTNLNDRLNALSSNLSIEAPIDVSAVEQMLHGCRRLAESPCPAGIPTDSPEWAERGERLEKLLRVGRTFTAAHRKYDSRLLPESWNRATSELQRRVLPYRDRWWRVLSSTYRTCKMEISRLCCSDPPRTSQSMLDLLSAIVDHQICGDEIRRNERLLKEMFIPLWKGPESDWTLLTKVFEWIRNANVDINSGTLPDWVVKSSANTLNRAELKRGTAKAESSLAEYKKALTELCELIGFDGDFTRGFDRSRSFRTMGERLTDWIDSVDAISDIASYNLRCETFRREGLEALVTLTDSWERAGDFLKVTFDRHWFECLVERAFAERRHWPVSTAQATQKWLRDSANWIHFSSNTIGRDWRWHTGIGFRPAAAGGSLAFCTGSLRRNVGISQFAS
ncbi:MAG: DUF4011 domain-containing protein [Acidobacteria bacterium]|nr:DUF4011 domain-containing protein [Acidobacteriota bacterium]